MGDCCVDVGLLALFGSAAEQDHEPLSILAKVNAVAGTEIQAQFKDARTYAFCYREIAPFESVEEHGDPCLGTVIQLTEPSLKGISPKTVDVLTNFYYISMVAQKTPL